MGCFKIVYCPKQAFCWAAVNKQRLRKLLPAFNKPGSEEICQSGREEIDLGNWGKMTHKCLLILHENTKDAKREPSKFFHFFSLKAPLKCLESG